MAELAERGEAGSEVVDRNLHAEIVQSDRLPSGKSPCASATASA
jgi:hypothetical protein